MEDIIQIAANNNFFGLKGNTQYTNILKNKNCGDEIKVEFDIKQEGIKNFRYEGETCIYCQASASLLANSPKKFNLKNLNELKVQIEKYFNEKKNNLKFITFGFEKILKNKNKNRKECILLPINAILDKQKK